jgi:hypothetical protein
MYPPFFSDPRSRPIVLGIESEIGFALSGSLGWDAETHCRLGAHHETFVCNHTERVRAAKAR